MAALARGPPARAGVHLDTAAAGRCSTATLRAAAGHAEQESATGAYVAQAQAQPVLEAGRASLAGLLGMPAAGLVFTESASTARGKLLAAWPLQQGDVVAVVPSEWGPNLAAFAGRGLTIIELPVLADGTLDLGQLKQVLAAAPPAVVHLTRVASHRGLVQPVAQTADLCHAAGVALWVDAAQALGHVNTDCGADAVYATSRKWLAGPRGVGVLAVSQSWWDRLRMQASGLARASLAADASPVRLLESGEANVAGRVGLCTAVRQHLDAGPASIWQRLAEVGALTRQTLAGLPGWEVIDHAGAITALRPRAGQDVHQTRARLLETHGILTTARIPARCPAMAAPGEPGAELTIDELALRAQLPVRTIREYQTLRLLPPPERRGRVGFYGPGHLQRLELIGRLQRRGYSLAGIRDLLQAWAAGTGLTPLLGTEPGPAPLDEIPLRLTHAELLARVPALSGPALARAREAGLIHPDGDGFLVRSPALLTLVADGIAAGVPVSDMLSMAGMLRQQLTPVAEAVADLIAGRLLPAQQAGQHPAELATLLQRGRLLLLQAAASTLADSLAAALLHRSAGADGAPVLRAALEQIRVGAVADASGNIRYPAAH